ncbi:MAG TPA: hypothetical protein VEJ19_02845 [Nitrososphaerales archaeon]|nr:hypothetical protein [Nitrososphaerales archaeon]
MPSAIEQTVQALVEFESALDEAKAELLEAKKRAMKDGLDWADAARNSAIADATEIAAQRVAAAKAEAEAQAKTIKERGESELKAFEVSISRHKVEAAEFAASKLLGEQK